MEFTIRTSYKMKLCEDRHIDIVSEPEGDFFHSFDVELQMSNEPTLRDILDAAKRRWIYRPVRVSIHVENPPVDMRLSIHTHYSLSGIKREYFLPSYMTIEPLIMPDERFEWSFHGQLPHCCQQIVFAMLPGDRIDIHMFKKEPFRGKLEVLFCASSPPV